MNIASGLCGPLYFRISYTVFILAQSHFLIRVQLHPHVSVEKTVMISPESTDLQDILNNMEMYNYSKIIHSVKYILLRQIKIHSTSNEDPNNLNIMDFQIYYSECLQQSFLLPPSIYPCSF